MQLHLQVVHTLTDGIVPSPELVATIKRLYDTKLKVSMDHHLYMFTISIPIRSPLFI